MREVDSMSMDEEEDVGINTIVDIVVESEKRGREEGEEEEEDGLLIIKEATAFTQRKCGTKRRQ